MTRRRDRVTLGDLLESPYRESSQAAYLYNPGFDPSPDGDPRRNTNQRDPNSSLDPGKHDLSGVSARLLQEYAEKNVEKINIYAPSNERAFLPKDDDGHDRADFNSKTQSSARLGDFVRRYHESSDYQQFPKDTDLLTRHVRDTGSGNTGIKSTAYTGPAPEGTVNFEVHADLQEKNLHAPDRAFLNRRGDGMEDETIRDGMYSLQGGSMGKFDRNRKRMQVEDLKRAALATLENARGIEGSAGRGNNDIGSGGEGLIDLLLSAAAPTVAVLQSVADLRVSRVESVIEKFESQAESGQDDIARIYDYFDLSQPTSWGGSTYGHLNTPAQPFTGIPIGMVLTAFIGMVIVRPLILGYSRLLSWIVMSETNEMKAGFGTGLDKLLRGSIRGIRNELGLVMPKNAVQEFYSAEEIEDIMMRGFYEFYGFYSGKNIARSDEEYEQDDERVDLSDRINPFNYTAVWDTPTYYATVARLFMRDATIILRAAKSITDYGNFSSVINDLLTSYGFRMISTFFKLGMGLRTLDGKEIHLTSSKKIEQSNLAPEERGDRPGFDSKMSYLGNEQVANFLRTRNSAPNLRFLVSTPPPSNLNPLDFIATGLQYLLSSTTFAGSTLSAKFFPSMLLGNPKAPISSDPMAAVQRDPGVKRFTPEQVEEIERVIDNDYVPFTIQDVRTNEVISLPAFIETVGDSFNVTYESTHGYGRTDPVHSYSKTERTINMTFALVAMNEEDHQHVWNVVNRLVSMCYPQRSAGTRQTDAQWEFTQPFSQVPTASPLVRIRLGDIVRGNRTASSFEWLFGDLVSQSPSPSAAPAAVAANAESSSRIENSLYKISNLQKFKLSKQTGKIKKLKKDEGYYSLLDYNGLQAGQEITVEQRSVIQVYGDLKDAITEVNRQKIKNAYGYPNESEDPLRRDAVGRAGDYQFYRFYEAVHKNLKNRKESTDFILFLTQGEATYVASCVDLANDSLVLVEDEPTSAAPASTPASSPPRAPDKNDFYKPGNNAVVRSFHSTAGRGLAGFIKDLQLDYAGFTWRTDMGARAPWGIKITMSFAPIHDMPLGLGSDGRMISPSHPVGVPYPGLAPPATARGGVAYRGGLSRSP